MAYRQNESLLTSLGFYSPKAACAHVRKLESDRDFAAIYSTAEQAWQQAYEQAHAEHRQLHTLGDVLSSLPDAAEQIRAAKIRTSPRVRLPFAKWAGLGLLRRGIQRKGEARDRRVLDAQAALENRLALLAPDEDRAASASACGSTRTTLARLLQALLLPVRRLYRRT